MELRPFLREDFETYSTWFSDQILNRELGPLDDAWLNSTLSDPGRATFCVQEHARLIAVVGLCLPDRDHRICVITEFAVLPVSRRQGIGRRALSLLVASYPLPGDARWAAYVMKDNGPARLFFLAQGWSLDDGPPGSGMDLLIRAEDGVPGPA